MRKLDTAGLTHYAVPLLAVVVLGVVGTYLTISSHAYVNPGPGSASAANPWTGKCPGNKVKYGSPKGKTATTSARKKVFGKPYPHASVTQVSFMGQSLYINKKVAPCLKAVEWDLKHKFHTRYKVEHAYGASALDSQNPSNYFHAYGGAIDINPAQNPQCYGGCRHTMPKTWVNAFYDHGFFWGGNFPNHKDYMHFEWHGQI